MSHCVNSNDDYIAFALFYIELIVTGNLFMTPMTHKTSRLEFCQYLSNYTSAEANTLPCTPLFVDTLLSMFDINTNGEIDM